MSINPQSPAHREGARPRVREKAVLAVQSAVRAQTRARVLAVVVLAVILSTHGGSVFATPATGARTAGPVPGVASAVRAGAAGAGGFGQAASGAGQRAVAAPRIQAPAG